MLLDSRPFFSLSHILAGLADQRIWVYAELVDSAYTPRTEATWTPGYHGASPPLPCTLFCCSACLQRHTLMSHMARC